MLSSQRGCLRVALDQRGGLLTAVASSQRTHSKGISPALHHADDSMCKFRVLCTTDTVSDNIRGSYLCGQQDDSSQPHTDDEPAARREVSDNLHAFTFFHYLIAPIAMPKH